MVAGDPSRAGANSAQLCALSCSPLVWRLQSLGKRIKPPAQLFEPSGHGPPQLLHWPTSKTVAQMTGGSPCARRRAPSTLRQIDRQEHQDWDFCFQTCSPFDAPIARQEYQTTRLVFVSTRQKFPGGRLRSSSQSPLRPVDCSWNRVTRRSSHEFLYLGGRSPGISRSWPRLSDCASARRLLFKRRKPETRNPAETEELLPTRYR